MLVEDSGSLRFPVACFTGRFAELAARTHRQPDLDLYVDLLESDELVVRAAQAIDDELPGE